MAVARSTRDRMLETMLIVGMMMELKFSPEVLRIEGVSVM
jgi:hypothetical protein